MDKTIISPTKANCLYWLGRYTERMYLELHLLRLCFDSMIDGQPEEYGKYLQAVGNTSLYENLESTRYGLVHDTSNPISIISCIERANDNAVILRDEIMSPTLGYIQMSLESLRHAAKDGLQPNIEELQRLTDWTLAFWGSVEERVYDENVKLFLRTGKLVEHIEMNIRFDYKFYRIEEAFRSLKKCAAQEPRIFEQQILASLETELTEEKYNPKDWTYKSDVLELLGKVVTL